MAEMRRSQRKALTAGLLGLVALLFVWTAASLRQFGWEAQFAWEARLIAWKMKGALPYVEWSEVFRAVAFSFRHEESVSSFPVFVRVRERSDGPCPIQWDTPVGPFWGRNTDAHLLWFLLVEQLRYRIYERPPVVVRKGDVVFDVGSHLGTFTRYALARGARRVVAFEPEPTNIACFQRTFRKEIAEGRVTLVEAALWETPGVLNLTVPDSGNTGTGSVVSSRGKAIAVPATTMDDTVRRLGLDRVDFIKMDIEGAERHALRGGRQTISRFGPRMALCIYHRADDKEVIAKVVLEARPSYRQFTNTQQTYFY